jgi:hypothetical protein
VFGGDGARLGHNVIRSADTDYAADDKYLGDPDARGSGMRTHLEIETNRSLSGREPCELQLPGTRAVGLAGAVNGRQR